MIKKETGGKPVRAFVSVELPREIREAILKLNESLNEKGIKLVSEAQLHATLFFFPKIDNAKLMSVIRLFETFKYEKFKVSVEGLSLFTPGRPRIIYAKINDNGAMEDIYRRLRNQIKGIGLGIEEREFTPHVTIARAKGVGREEALAIKMFVSEHGNDNYGSFTCDKIKIIKSDLTNEGPVYTELYTKNLSEKA